MNDRHPSGTAHYAAHDGYSTTSFATDPLFGDLPGDSPDTGSYATGAYDTGSYDTGHWYADPGHQQQQHNAAYPSSYDTGGYDTTGAWPTSGYEQSGGIPAQSGGPGQHTGQWDTTAYDGTQTFGTQTFEAPAFDTQTFETQTFETQTFEAPAFGTQSFETQSLDAQPFDTQHFDTQHLEAQHPDAQTYDTQSFESPVFGATAYDTGAYDATQWNSGGTPVTDTGQLEAVHEPVPDPGQATDAAPDPYGTDEPAAEHPEPVAEEREFASRAAARGRSRRRTPAKRSALLTVAVPSVCVVGIAGIAAASVGVGGGGDDTETQAMTASDATAVKPSTANNKLDTQLADLSQDAGDFADRASRTQERIDLKAKQEADRKKAAEEAARKEAARPKFAIPVKQHGLSAYYGQAGINWMSVHSGIDFPVSYGTPVMAATDGTVRTQWNSAYGNMAIVTAKDGTETWYCHLSAHTVMSGPVKAGDVIARSGNSGNSTGPHLHFEVRPGGGSAIDPLPWLRSHGLDPT
ncbi:M23 family metallopeptidase [Streptomyces sp. NPDC046716]|uniref:M23 family metallopeptidase n=1 Tax=Streptomyces sp. NPDC046716 TaxID=3157093 RepID=UPI0033FEF72D